jgi:methyltransferase (TIGR00027 family)
MFVANGIWWVTNHPRLFLEVPELMGSLNLGMVQHFNSGFFSPEHRVGSWLLNIKTSIMQSASLPGFYLHYVVRKRCIEKFAMAAIAGGAEQVVVIGAGFDTLSLRIATEYPDLSIIEIDHPATQAWKREALGHLDLQFDNIHFLSLDLLRDTMQEVLLQSTHYDRNKPSVFVAEGLLMYLTEKEIAVILNFIKAESGPGSRFIFTCMEENAEGDYQFRNASWLTSAWLSMKREVFTWGLRSDQLAPFLRRSDFQLLEFKTHKDLREEFVSDGNRGDPLAIGENVAVAQWDLESNPNRAPSRS